MTSVTSKSATRPREKLPRCYLPRRNWQLLHVSPYASLLAAAEISDFLGQIDDACRTQEAIDNGSDLAGFGSEGIGEARI